MLESPQVTPAQRLGRILEEEAVEPPVRAKVLRRFSESGAVDRTPLRVALDEEVRDDVVEGRASRHLAEMAERLRREVEKAYGSGIKTSDHLEAGGLVRNVAEETIRLLGWAARSDVVDVSLEAARAILTSASFSTDPVVTVPHTKDVQEMAVVLWGQVEAVQEACEHLLREAEEGEERAAGLELLKELRDRSRVIPALARIQELVTLALTGPLLEHENWRTLALESEPQEVDLGFRVLTDPPREVSLSHLLLLSTLQGSLLDLLSREDFRERYGDVGVRAKLVAQDREHPSPTGFLLAVNDPFVSQASIDRAVRDARAELQRQTEESKLAPDDREFLNLVAEVEDEHGIGPEDRRPHGFWSVVRERWNDDHPDRTLKPSAIRTWWHRKGPTSKLG